LLDYELPIELAFRLADNVTTLETKKSAIEIALNKAKEKDNLNDIWKKEADIQLAKISKKELLENVEKIPTRALLAIKPILED
jgi:hypothetical protein